MRDTGVKFKNLFYVLTAIIVLGVCESLTLRGGIIISFIMLAIVLCIVQC